MAKQKSRLIEALDAIEKMPQKKGLFGTGITEKDFEGLPEFCESVRNAGLRPETMAFARAMDKEKDRHQAEKGDSWAQMSVPNLLGFLDAAVEKLYTLRRTDDKEEYIHQCVDVANIASFIKARWIKEIRGVRGDTDGKSGS